MRRTSTTITAVIGALSIIAGIGFVVAEHPAGASAGSNGSTTPTAEPGRRVSTIGDSIMAGYGLDSDADAWPAMLARADHLDVTNLACSGAGFVVDGDCGDDFAGLVSQAVAVHPSIVVLQSSDNDLGQDPAAIDTATRQAVDQLHAALPHARIVGFSTLWDQPGDVPDEVAQSSTSLRRAVEADGGRFVDLGQPLVGHVDLLQADSEHPTVAGQRVLTRVVERALRRARVPL